MELVINNDKYYIPNKWNEVALGCYMEFVKHYDEEAEEVQKQTVLLSAFTGAPIDMLGSIKKKVLDKAVERLNELFIKPANKDLNLIVNIDGVDYGFHPNLADLKLKEFVDLDNKLEKGWEAMDAVMSILYRPVVEQKKDKYKIEEYDFISANKRAEIFKKQMSVDTVNGAAAFFLNIGIDYIAITKAYSKTMPNRTARRKAIKQTKKSLTKTTVGIK